MSKSLVIVESPAKSRTIEKYLGKDFKVFASYGHVRDLIPKEGAVDPDHDFAMKYQVIDKNAKHVDAIKKALKKADNLYLATDPDREGEAISWHLYQLLDEAGLLKDKNVQRVVFHEITKRVVQDAIENPRDLSDDLVDAQQARRALDYLVGFNLSPLLWKKIRRGLSAGRVQSPALRMIVERELEIEAFNPQEYWSVEADLNKSDTAFRAKLFELQGEKQKQFSITNAEQAAAAKKQLLESAAGELTVSQVEKKQRKRNPVAPFTTSTLQQEASRKLGFTAQRTMRVAQQLYEGVDVGEGAEGLITYMRTDSVNLSVDAVEDIRGLIAEQYGQSSVPASPNTYKTKSKNAQEAHEAIRPTAVRKTPDAIKKFLSDEQFKLYSLIWKRAVASQMIYATINTVSVTLDGHNGNVFRATGSTIAAPGFLAVYEESKDDSKDDDKDKLLPPMEKGEKIKLLDVITTQHFTEPPPRYSEASLVKSLEEHGIGRPSTYAAIISTLVNREYVELDKKRFYPTDVGRIVNKFLTEHFGQYVDYDFTAKLEDALDEVSRGEKEWVPLMKEFWGPFHELIVDKDQSVSRADVTQEKLEEECPKCGKHLVMRLGKRGRFIGCSDYPECDYTRNVGDEKTVEPEIVEGRDCPKCGSQLLIRNGRYGKFIGCSNYPNCKHIESLEQPEDTKVECPKCHEGHMLKRKSRRGKIFYSCSTYPKCDYALWNEPIEEACGKCAWPLVTLKTTKRYGTQKVCPNCNDTQDVETDESAEENS